AITITGTNDAPVITSGAQAGGVFEGDGGTNQTATGQVTFTDVDASDTHGYSATAAAHGTASVDASGHWTYTATDSGAVDALASGETLADSFVVTVADNHLRSALPIFAITITGTNDAP